MGRHLRLPGIIFWKHMESVNNFDRRLKPCPFCGKKMHIWRNAEYHRLEVKHAERTDDCPMYKSWLYNTEDALIESWNKRTFSKK